MSDIVHVIRASVDPSGAPARAGQHWVNTATNKTWLSVGTATVADWVEVTPNDNKLKVSSNDSTPNFLENKVVVDNGTNSTNPLESSTLNDGGDEDLRIRFDQTKLSVTSSQVSDFTEATQDVVGALVSAGTGISVNYSDVGNSLSITNTDLGSSAISTHEAASDPHPQYLQATNSDLNALLPSQTGNNGKYLKTDGTNTSWQKELSWVHNSSTGVYKGGVLSIGTPNTTFSISDGSGRIVDSATDGTSPVSTEVSWSGKTNITVTNIATNLLTYVSIDSGANVIQRVVPLTPTQRRQEIFLGVVVHVNLTNVDAVNNEQESVIDPTAQVHDLSNAIGFFNVTGNVFSPNGSNLKLNKSLGSLYKAGANWDSDRNNPNIKTLPALTALTFQYRLQNGTNGATGTDIDPNNYDLSGSLTPVPVGKWTIQRIYSFVSNNVKVQPGQFVYNTLAEAKAAIQVENFVTETSIANNGLLRAFLIVKRNAVNLSSVEAYFLDAGKFGATSGVGGLSVTSLQGAYDNSLDPEILTNSTSGAVTIRRGSAADTDNVLEIQNNAGTVNASITGNGVTTLNGQLNANGGVDRSTSGTLAIGTGVNSTTINIGNAGATVNIQGTTNYQNVTQLQVTDPLITINKGGGAASGSDTGLEIEENSSITGYNKTSGDRNSWTMKAPNTAGIATITPGAGGITLNQSSHDAASLGSFGSTPNSSGASLSGQQITLQPADATNPGGVSTTTQTFAGDKTFSGTISASNLSGTNTGDQTITLTSDVTGSGTGSFAATIASNAVTNAKLADMATQTFKGRTTAGTGDPEDLTVAQAKTLLNLTGTNSGDQTITLTGNVTGSGTGSFAATIANDAVTNAKMANMATQTFKGRTTAGTGDPEDLTATQATALLNNMVGDSGSGGTKGLVPAPASGDAAANKFLKANGSWAAVTAAFDPTSQIDMFDDFASGSTSGTLGWTAAQSGSASSTSASDTALTGSIFGTVVCATGTTATGRASLALGTNTEHNVVFTAASGIVYSIKFKAKLSAVSDGTNTYGFIAGWGDTPGTSATGYTQTAGVYFLHDSTASANWQCVTKNGGTTTTTTSTAVDANWHTFEIIVTSTASAVFKIDGATVATHNVDIPTAAVTNMFKIAKSLGSTARSVTLDYFWQNVTWNGAR